MVLQFIHSKRSSKCLFSFLSIYWSHLFFFFFFPKTRKSEYISLEEKTDLLDDILCYSEILLYSLTSSPPTMKTDSSLCRVGILCILKRLSVCVCLVYERSDQEHMGRVGVFWQRTATVASFTTKTRNTTFHISQWDSQHETENVMDLSESQSDFWWSCLWKTTRSTCSFWIFFKIPKIHKLFTCGDISHSTEMSQTEGFCIILFTAVLGSPFYWVCYVYWAVTLLNNRNLKFEGQILGWSSFIGAPACRERHFVELSYVCFPWWGGQTQIRTVCVPAHPHRHAGSDLHTHILAIECKVNHCSRQYLCQTLWPWRRDTGRSTEPWQQSSVNPADEKSVFVLYRNWLVNFCMACAAIAEERC